MKALNEEKVGTPVVRDISAAQISTTKKCRNLFADILYFFLIDFKTVITNLGQSNGNRIDHMLPSLAQTL